MFLKPYLQPYGFLEAAGNPEPGRPAMGQAEGNLSAPTNSPRAQREEATKQRELFQSQQRKDQGITLLSTESSFSEASALQKWGWVMPLIIMLGAKY